ncbi:tRNA N6-adenosine threonylcarbamoyltransferase [Pirellulimonas nuda]|uniref:tRNA N6-adenosine threonylcarbamoyltransferase n=1 Tax=Pirellulimonas nuda TaxID=2528009 RepID=A0A518DI79_9BACT|nr:tRNA (adenosine(37)-N6)-threonylcarbamoyltransferase complex transferase subunit TsaD [Pirellulimonas nuda]QDU91175.1 tRNA N6-adenosine threonylcarbamoyltransferase [Pirellulimonas nuda]
MKVLTIETTCDETAAAVITDDLEVLSAVVASQEELHQRYGGVVPEIASRAHVQRILPVIDQALRQSGQKLADLDAIAVATTPGLSGSLLIGLTAAKTLAALSGLPLVAINHLQAHIYACRIASGREVFPCIGLIASGGHSNLYRCEGPIDFTPIGATIDDAAGEAFDKVACLLGLPYPGGPAIEHAAQRGDRTRYRFPRPLLADAGRLDFSFSGLKTAVRYQVVGVGKLPESLSLSEQEVADVSASFQEAVVDCLVGKCEQALLQTGYTTLCVGGGVAANGRFRQRLEASSAERRYTLHIPPLSLCTDNAVMGAIAIERLRAGLIEPLDLDISPGLVRM